MNKEEYERKKQKISKARFPKEAKDRLLKELEDEYNIQNSIYDNEVYDMLLKSIVGTIDNHPNDFAFGSGMASLLGRYLVGGDSNIELAEFFSRYVSERSYRYNVPLRKRIIDYYYNNKDKNVVLDLLNVLYDVTGNETLSEIINSINSLNGKVDTKNGLDGFSKLYSLMSSNEINYQWFHIIFCDFYNKLDITKVFKDEFNVNDDIIIEEVTDTCYQFLTNAENYKLKDSFNGTLLHGNIQVSSDRGYKTHPSMPQQDAVGSMVYDDNHFINIVADGVGGVEEGHIASLELVKDLLNWYKSLPIEVLDDVEIVNSELDKELNRINKKILEKYHKRAQSTVVIATAVGDKTIISNLGDSTAYSYDEENDELIELTTLDSYSYGMSYEQARFNPENNVITQDIGHSYNIFIHTNIIDNVGQKIILSSDGITDLTSEERFKSYFRNDVTSKQMVERAVNNPDVALYKDEDNVSAVVINLPNGISKRRGM